MADFYVKNPREDRRRARVNLIMRDHNCSRDEAERRLDRMMADQRRYEDSLEG